MYWYVKGAALELSDFWRRFYGFPTCASKIRDLLLKLRDHLMDRLGVQSELVAAAGSKLKRTSNPHGFD